jgi:gamma-glutamyltranspeptidase/glutathione hydrolase
MAPTLVLENGEVFLVLGSPGGSTIPSTIVQVLRNIVDYSMPLDDAIDAFRVHHGVFPDHFRFEGQRPPPQTALNGLRRAGHQFSPSRIPMGDANCLMVGTGEAWGYADPREGGLALAAKRDSTP